MDGKAGLFVEKDKNYVQTVYVETKLDPTEGFWWVKLKWKSYQGSREKESEVHLSSVRNLNEAWQILWYEGCGFDKREWLRQQTLSLEFDVSDINCKIIYLERKKYNQQIIQKIDDLVNFNLFKFNLIHYKFI